MRYHTPQMRICNYIGKGRMLCHVHSSNETKESFCLRTNKVWLTYKALFLNRLSKSLCRPTSTAMWIAFQHSCFRCVSDTFCSMSFSNTESHAIANEQILVPNFVRYWKASDWSVERHTLQIHTMKDQYNTIWRKICTLKCQT